MKVTALDVLVAVWVVLWLSVALAVREEVRTLSLATGSAERVARNIERTGKALESLGDLPLVGGDVAEAGREVGEGARETAAIARDGRESGLRLGNLLAAAIALGPVVPLLLLYLPGRVAAERERRAALGASDEVLAARARLHLPLERLVALGDDDHALAAAERRRLGAVGHRGSQAARPD